MSKSFILNTILITTLLLSSCKGSEASRVNRCVNGVEYDGWVTNSGYLVAIEDDLFHFDKFNESEASDKTWLVASKEENGFKIRYWNGIEWTYIYTTGEYEYQEEYISPSGKKVFLQIKDDSFGIISEGDYCMATLNG